MDYKNAVIGCLPEDRPERIARGLFASRSATRLDVSQLYNIKIFFKIKESNSDWISEFYPSAQNSNSANASDRQEGRTRQKEREKKEKLWRDEFSGGDIQEYIANHAV